MRSAGHISDNEGSGEPIDMARDGARGTQLNENPKLAESNPLHLMGRHQQRHVADQLILGNAKNRDKIHLATRIDSFRNGWPAHLTSATINEFAEAGLFYLGESDRTKCFYCNGRLNQWEYNDNPWVEHAKWYPTCEFVLAKKGSDFVLNVMKAYTKQNRLQVQNSSGLVANPNFPITSHTQTTHAAIRRRNRCPGQKNFVAVPIRPAKRGTTESDALPIVHCHTSDAETEPAPVYVFIPNQRCERDRLASFTTYPNGPFLPSMWLAARQGLSFTGVRDIARCFSCNATWHISQGAYTTNLHHSDCEMTSQQTPLGNFQKTSQFLALLQQGQGISQPAASSGESAEEPEAGPSSPKRPRTNECSVVPDS